MLKNIFIYFLFLLLIIPAFSQEKFKVFIVQDDMRKEVLYNDSGIMLKSEPFKIEVHLINIEGIYASISFDTLYYKTPLGTNFKDWDYIGSKAMAEDKDNEDQSVVAAYEVLGYWFYDPEVAFNRFDAGIEINGDTVIATMTVATIIDGETGDDISLQDITYPLYLVFFSTDYQSGKRIETERKKTVLYLK